ncbi:hypothetical protein [Streptomyces sp. NPDC091215]|uniref:hypothetical protein n=1 Tax=Streptomyces sp. NPDC091215 TaxID=3155192 RepID=UPI0034248A0E
MDGTARMWIGSIPSFDPDGRGVILAVDQASSDPAERMVCVLLNRGHEGEEGVFYLLPGDLWARYERTGERLRVSLLARRDVLADDLKSHPAALRAHLAGLPRDPGHGDRVVLVCRETVTDFVPPEHDGVPQPVVLIDHVGGPVGLAELVGLFDARESGIAVVAATPGH